MTTGAIAAAGTSASGVSTRGVARSGASINRVRASISTRRAITTTATATTAEQAPSSPVPWPRFDGALFLRTAAPGQRAAPHARSRRLPQAEDEHFMREMGLGRAIPRTEDWRLLRG